MVDKSQLDNRTNTHFWIWYITYAAGLVTIATN